MTRTGRPKLDNAKRTFIGLRLDDADIKRLDAICEAKKFETRSEAIRYAIQKVADQGKK